MIQIDDPHLRNLLPKLRRKHKDLFWLDLKEFPGRLTDCLVRPLTRREFFQVQQDIELGCDPTEIILETAVIWPQVDWDNLITNSFYDIPYRVFDDISEAILSVSGFIDSNHIAAAFSNARRQVQSFDAAITTVICSQLASIHPKMLDDMTLEDIARLYAIAEQMLPEPLDLRMYLDEEYARRQMDKEKRKQARSSRVPGVPGSFTRVDPSQVPPIPEGFSSSADMRTLSPDVIRQMGEYDASLG